LAILKKLRQVLRGITKRHEFVSIVILLRQSRDLPESKIRAAAERAWECKMEGTESAPGFVQQKGLRSVVWIPGHFLSIVNASRPYGDGQAWLAQRAFTSIDYIDTEAKEITPDQKYSVVAKLASALLESDCAGIYIPGEREIIPASPDLAGQLRNFSTLGKFYETLVIAAENKR
jgi:hypothetical protein